MTYHLQQSSLIISAIRRKSIKNETERVSITENPFHSSEKESLRRKEGINRREKRLVQEDNFSSDDIQETVFATADDVNVYKNTLIL